MCSNSNVWLEMRTQASPAIRGHARTSNHHPSKKYLTTTTHDAFFLRRARHKRFFGVFPLHPRKNFAGTKNPVGIGEKITTLSAHSKHLIFL
jgi:hypothetical protein